jgi:exosome complex component RRP42
MTYENKQNILKYLKEGIRPDGRKVEEYREIEVEYDISKSAEGSARVKIGDTEVLAGVKLAIEKPYPDSPEDGTMMIGAELLPLSNPEFESGPPNIQAVELARVVDRGIRESKAIDTKKLLIEKGEKAWVVMIDIVTLNDAGNLFDAAALASLAALKNTKFPDYDGTKIDYKKKTQKGLPITKLPISITVLKIGDFLIVDPINEEEKVIDARLTVAISGDKICALQKGGDSPLTLEDIGKMIELAFKKSKELKKTIGE